MHALQLLLLLFTQSSSKGDTIYATCKGWGWLYTKQQAIAATPGTTAAGAGVAAAATTAVTATAAPQNFIRMLGS
jgi:hypothetical protein